MQTRRFLPDPVNLSIQLYQAMLSLYPTGFREEYGGLMMQVFRDSCLRTRAKSHEGLLGLWGRVMVDYLVSILEQYANRGAVMTKHTFVKISGWLMLLAGVLFFLGFVATQRPEYSQFNAASWPIDRYLKLAAVPLLIISVILTAVGIMGLRARFKDEAGVLGGPGWTTSLVGCLVTLAGFVGSEFVAVGPWWELLMLGLTLIFAGLVVFGIASLRRKLFKQWSFIPLLPGLIWLTAFAFSVILTPNLPDWITGVLFGVIFIGLSFTGYLLQAASPSQTASLT